MLPSVEDPSVDSKNMIEKGVPYDPRVAFFPLSNSSQAGLSKVKRKYSLMVEITIVAVGIIRYKEKRKSSTCHSLDLLSHHLRLLLGQRV